MFVGTRVGVGVKVETGVAKGGSEAEGGVNVGGGVSIFSVVVSVAAGASPERRSDWPAPSKITAAWAEAKERSVPTRKVMATRMNRMAIKALGGCERFIGMRSIT